MAQIEAKINTGCVRTFCETLHSMNISSKKQNKHKTFLGPDVNLEHHQNATICSLSHQFAENVNKIYSELFKLFC